MTLNDKQKALCREHDFDFSKPSAIFLNCTLNQRIIWDAGCRSDHPNPEYR